MKNFIDNYGHVMCLLYVTLMCVTVGLMNTLGLSQIANLLLKAGMVSSVIFSVYFIFEAVIITEKN